MPKEKTPIFNINLFEKISAMAWNLAICEGKNNEGERSNIARETTVQRYSCETETETCEELREKLNTIIETTEKRYPQSSKCLRSLSFFAQQGGEAAVIDAELWAHGFDRSDYGFGGYSAWDRYNQLRDQQAQCILNSREWNDLEKESDIPFQPK
ncbi:MAG: hypothetical protein WBO70_04925 [Erysipelotrichaceae bacterium]